MHNTTVKSDLHEIADKLSESASYTDAMYQLFVRMKVSAGKQAIAEKRVVSHEDVKARFSK